MEDLTLPRSQPVDEESIQNWLIDNLALMLNLNSEEIDITVSFERYGLDSEKAIELTGDLSNWLGISIEPELFYDYPTIEKATNYLKELLNE